MTSKRRQTGPFEWNYLKTCVRCGAPNLRYDQHVIIKLAGKETRVPVCDACKPKIKSQITE